MKNTGFNNTRNVSNIVTDYSYLSTTKSEKAYRLNPHLLYSSGGLYSTSKDLLKFYSGIKSYKIIPESSLNEAITPFENGYGLGWFIDTLENDTLINHGGNIEGFTSYFVMNLEKDICIVLLNNITSRSLERIGNSIYRVITEKKYTLPKPKQEIVLKQELLSSYVGVFEISSSLIAKVNLENNHLFLQMNNDEKLKLSAENFFFYWRRRHRN